MTRATLIQLTCDRCCAAETGDDPAGWGTMIANGGAGRTFYLEGEQVDLCPNCATDLDAFVRGAKLDPAGSGLRADTSRRVTISLPKAGDLSASGADCGAFLPPDPKRRRGRNRSVDELLDGVLEGIERRQSLDNRTLNSQPEDAA